ncbi:MAG: RES family NAD+ phosphorylase [Deltaproteobacteria bacterium]|nr:RES family NAD+ phosphorylase [Deltaproteobacteria bacterium]
MIRAADLPVRDIVEPATVRLVTAGYLDKPALAMLADDPSEIAVLEEIEGLTSALAPPSPTVPSGIQPGELLTEADGYGWAYVNAAFCHPRPTGNRFNGPERGAWYASYGNNATDTAKAEVAWHLTRELQATGIYDNVTTYRELLAGFMSRFHDLGEGTGEAVLSDDPADAYPAGQALAREIQESGGNGVLYPSARYESGRCLAALRPNLVQNVREGDAWVFRWAGSLEVEISRLEVL